MPRKVSSIFEMETKYLVYKNNIDQGGGSCNSESDLLRFLDLKIQKFNLPLYVALPH